MKQKIEERLRDYLIDKEELTEKQERLLKTNIFMVKMLLVGAIFHLILFLYPSTIPLQEFYADIVTKFMNFAGFSFQSPSIYIMDGLKGYEITQDCLGWKSIMAFIALMYSTPKRGENYLKYVFLGISFLIVANFVRVITTIYLSWSGIMSFDLIHTFLWRWSLTAVVLVIWVVWLKYSDISRLSKEAISQARSHLL